MRPIVATSRPIYHLKDEIASFPMVYWFATTAVYQQSVKTASEERNQEERKRRPIDEAVEDAAQVGGGGTGKLSSGRRAKQLNTTGD